jgi:hypothetical protein
MASQKASARHKVEPARLDMSQVWSKAQAVIQVSPHTHFSFVVLLRCFYVTLLGVSIVSKYVIGVRMIPDTVFFLYILSWSGTYYRCASVLSQCPIPAVPLILLAYFAYSFGDGSIWSWFRHAGPLVFSFLPVHVFLFLP